MATPATCAKKKYSAKGTRTAHTNAANGWLVRTKNAAAANAIIAVNTRPNTGIEYTMISMTIAIPSRRMYAIAVSSTSDCDLDSSYAALRPAASSPKPVRPVKPANTYGQKTGDKTMFRTLLGAETKVGIAMNMKKAEATIAPMPRRS